MILAFLTAIIITNAGVNQSSLNQTGMLRGGVSVEKDLPKEIFGEWRVASQTIETNNPEYWGDIGLDRWIFARIGDKVTLSNPKSSAVSSITVNEVVGNKAKFSREKVTEDYTETENLEITISGVRFSGTDTQIIKHLNKDKGYKTDVVKYRVVGEKISGSALKDLFAK